MTRKEWLYEFGDNLAKILKEYPMTQTELAEVTGLSRSTINNYILGKRMPSVDAILAISYAINCTTDELIDFMEPIDR